MDNLNLFITIFMFVMVFLTFVIQVYKFVKYQGKTGSVDDIITMITGLMPNIITTFEEYLKFKNDDVITYDDALNYVTVNIISVLEKIDMSEAMKKLITHDTIKTLVDPILSKLWDDFYAVKDPSTDKEELPESTEE